MAENKTQATSENVTEFLNKLEDGKKRSDCFAILQLMKRLTSEKEVMWGPSIIGFGRYHYKYDSGREGDFFLTGFSARKQNLTIYIMTGFEKEKELMSKLGKYKTGKSCLYIKKLEDIDLKILEELISGSVAFMREKYPTF